MNNRITDYLVSIHTGIVSSQIRRGKEPQSFSAWFAEISRLAAAERARVLGVDHHE